MNWDEFENHLLFLVYVAALTGRHQMYTVTRWGRHPNPDYDSRLKDVRLYLADRGWTL